MKNVLMIVQNDFVNDNRIIKEATTLGKNGYHVKVLAQYNTGLKIKEEYPFFEVERVIIRTRNKLSKHNLYIQLVKYVEFYIKCIKLAIKFKPEIIHCHDLSTLPIGSAIRQKSIAKVKFIYDSHELWTGMPYYGSQNSFKNRIVGYIEKHYIHKCDHVITVSNSIVEYLLTKYSLPKVPVLVRNTPNYFNVKNYKDYFRTKLNIEKSKKILLFIGSASIATGIDKILKAFPYVEKSIVLVMLGENQLETELNKIIKDNGLEGRVFFHEPVSYNLVNDYASSADAGIALIQNLCLSFQYALPNKLFDYIQSELPVLTSNTQDLQEIIMKYDIGIAIDTENPEGLAQSINLLLTEETIYKSFVNNIQKAKKELNWENEEKELLKLYNSF